MEHYVYRHIRLDKNEPFYVGIGHKKDNEIVYKRANSVKKRNRFWHLISSKTDYRVEIMYIAKDREDAILKEMEFIKLYGRKDINNGILTNLTDGGETTIGYKHTDEWKIANGLRAKGVARHTEESKRKIAKSKIGVKRDPLVVEKMRQSAIKNEKLQKRLHEYSVKRIGTKLSPEVKERIRLGLLGRKPIVQKSLNGDFVKEWPSPKSVKEQLGFDDSAIIAVCKYREGYRRPKQRQGTLTAYGYIWEYKNINKISTWQELT